MTACRYPDNTPLTGYVYGCRCTRCVEHNNAYQRRYRRANAEHRREYDRAYRRAHYVPRYRPSTIERILARITVDPVRGCWLWPTLSSNGYGQVKHNGRGTSPHRVLAEHYHGRIPDGYEVDHLCHVRACCNPDHLDVVHRLENASRAWQWSRAVNSGLITMTADLVASCRREHYDNGVSIRELAKRFDINRWTMRDAVTGRTWGELCRNAA